MDLSEKVRLLEKLEDYSSQNELKFRLSTNYILNGYRWEHLSDLGTLLLILAGEKSATVINTVIPPWKDAIARVLNLIGLPHYQREREPETRPGQQVIYAAKDRSWLQRIMKAERIRDHRELGRCFGYPETAIEAYLGERQRLENSRGIPIRLLTAERPVNLVSSFVCSVDFWQEEEKVLERWDVTLARLSPKLYQGIQTKLSS